MEQQLSGIRWRDKFCYGIGEAASGVTFGLVQSVLQKYYTDVLGIVSSVCCKTSKGSSG